jgi:hypothetical protein
MKRAMAMAMAMATKRTMTMVTTTKRAMAMALPPDDSKLIVDFLRLHILALLGLH